MRCASFQVNTCGVDSPASGRRPAAALAAVPSKPIPSRAAESSREKEHEQASRRVHARPEAHVLLAVQHVGLTTDRASDLGDGLNAQLDSILSRRQGKKSESMPSSTACSP